MRQTYLKDTLYFVKKAIPLQGCACRKFCRLILFVSGANDANKTYNVPSKNIPPATRKKKCF